MCKQKHPDPFSALLEYDSNTMKRKRVFLQERCLWCYFFVKGSIRAGGCLGADYTPFIPQVIKMPDFVNNFSTQVPNFSFGHLI